MLGQPHDYDGDVPESTRVPVRHGSDTSQLSYEFHRPFSSRAVQYFEIIEPSEQIHNHRVRQEPWCIKVLYVTTVHSAVVNTSVYLVYQLQVTIIEHQVQYKACLPSYQKSAGR